MCQIVAGECNFKMLHELKKGFINVTVKEHLLPLYRAGILCTVYSTCKRDRIVRSVVQFVLWCHTSLSFKITIYTWFRAGRWVAPTCRIFLFNRYNWLAYSAIVVPSLKVKFRYSSTAMKLPVNSLWSSWPFQSCHLHYRFRPLGMISFLFLLFSGRDDALQHRCWHLREVHFILVFDL